MKRILPLLHLALGLLAPAFSNAATLLGTVPYVLNGQTYTVEAWTYTNTLNNTPEYFLLTLPLNGTAPYPVIVFNNPYDLFPGPPSVNQADIEWTTNYRQNPNYTSFDIYRTPNPEYYSCRDRTSPWNPYECGMGVFGIATEDMHRNGNVAVETKANSTVDWALTHGYAVAVTYMRFYAGRDFGTVTYGTADAFEALKNMPGRIDPNRIGATGVSGGAGASLYPFAIPGRPLNIAAAVGEATPIDWRELVKFGLVDLPLMQPAAIYNSSWSWMATFMNVLIGTLGRNTTAAVWDLVTTPAVAARYNTPILLIAGTDDGMIPYTQSINLNNALRGLGKASNLWLYQNGLPDYAHQPIQNLAHGIFDANSAVKRRFLTRNYFLHRMPPNIPEVVVQHPQEFNLISIFAEFRQQVCADPAGKQNIAELMIQAGNPIIRYVSTDPAIPSTTGPGAIAAAINAVWHPDGVVWDGTNVMSHLQAGDLPACVNVCDLNGGGVSVGDVQVGVNQAIHLTACLPAGQPGSGDINRDGTCSVIDVQRLVNAALTGACVAP